MAVSNTDSLQHTPLFNLHGELGARMVPFAGYAMPVQYAGVKAEHLHTRAAAGLFDVSHMGQILVRGPGAAEALETLMPVDLVELPVNRQVYALLTNDRGGIRDDLMVCRWSDDCFLLVVNAACKTEDLAWLEANLTGLSIEHQTDKALIALQGPAAAQVMAQVVPATQTLTFMQGCHADYNGTALYVTRAGYTGEDGFEISLPAAAAEDFSRELLGFDTVAPVGLGARDTLRLEAGLCLYGHDLDDTVTPVTAALGWSISKTRRTGGARAGAFPGADIILPQLAQGTPTRRVGLRVDDRAPVREGAPLMNDNEQTIGTVTSGGFGPSIDGPIAMGYADRPLAEPGSTFFARVRNKLLPVTVVSLPFVPHRYVR